MLLHFLKSLWRQFVNSFPVTYHSSVSHLQTRHEVVQNSLYEREVYTKCVLSLNLWDLNHIYFTGYFVKRYPVFAMKDYDNIWDAGPLFLPVLACFSCVTQDWFLLAVVQNLLLILSATEKIDGRWVVSVGIGFQQRCFKGFGKKVVKCWKGFLEKRSMPQVC